MVVMKFGFGYWVFVVAGLRNQNQNGSSNVTQWEK